MAENKKSAEEATEEVMEEILEDLEEESAEKKAEAEKDNEEKAEEDGAEEETSEADEKTSDEEASEDKEGKFFKKTDKKKKKDDKKKNPLEDKVAELEDARKRQLAEFDNFRKRTEKEKAQMFETGAKSVIEKILPVVDNFERGLATVPEDEKDKPFAEGMNMIYKQLIDELAKIDVKPIEAVGKEFDPNFHNAVMQVESEEYESGIVAQELQKGYTYRDSVVRHSMVAVVP